MVHARKRDTQKTKFLLLFKVVSMFFIALVFGFGNVAFALTYQITGANNCKLEDTTLYYVTSPYLKIVYQTDTDESISILINNVTKFSGLTGSGEKTFEVSEEKFLLTIKSNKTGVIYNKTIDPIKLSIKNKKNFSRVG